MRNLSTFTNSSLLLQEIGFRKIFPPLTLIDSGISYHNKWRKNKCGKLFNSAQKDHHFEKIVQEWEISKTENARQIFSSPKRELFRRKNNRSNSYSQLQQFIFFFSSGILKNFSGGPRSLKSAKNTPSFWKRTRKTPLIESGAPIQVTRIYETSFMKERYWQMKEEFCEYNYQPKSHVTRNPIWWPSLAPIPSNWGNVPNNYSQIQDISGVSLSKCVISIVSLYTNIKLPFLNSTVTQSQL